MILKRNFKGATNIRDNLKRLFVSAPYFSHEKQFSSLIILTKRTVRITMRFKNNFESMELHLDFLTVLGGRPPQGQLENSKFEIGSLDSIFDTTYSMYRLLRTIYLAAVSKQSRSNARTQPVKQIVCRSFIFCMFLSVHTVIMEVGVLKYVF